MEYFEDYKKQGEPEKSQKAENWGVTIGLQQVDNLTPSKYLIEIAKDNIEGKISIDEAGEQISQYYKQNPAITTTELAQLLNISRRAVAKQTALLKEKGLIRRIGPDKGGHWEVLND